MRLKRNVHGRKMSLNLEVKGMVLSELYKELERKKWNINKLSTRAKTTYDDCELSKIYENIKNKNEENSAADCQPVSAYANGDWIS